MKLSVAREPWRCRPTLHTYCYS